MAFPHVIYGSFGDEKVTSSARIGNLPLGTKMILPDGSEFRHAKASATAMIAGNLYQQNIGIQGTDVGYKGTLATVTGAAGATTCVITAAGTTATTLDQFRDGYMHTAASASYGGGSVYKVKGNTVAAASAACTVTLDPNDAIKVAFSAGTTTVGLRENEYWSCTITTADTVGVGTLLGIAPVNVLANYYCWVQRSGRAAALTDGTIIVGEPVTPSGALAGAVTFHTPGATSTTKLASNIGWCMSVAASTKFSLIDLMLP